MTLAQIIASLTKGYIKKTGRQPFGLDKLRIKMEAAEKLRQMNKIVKFPQQRSFKQEIESMINDGTIKMGDVTKQSDKVRTRNMFKDSNLNKTEAELKTKFDKENQESIQRFKDKMKNNPEDMADGGRTGYKDGEDVFIGPKRKKKTKKELEDEKKLREKIEAYIELQTINLPEEDPFKKYQPIDYSLYGGFMDNIKGEQTGNIINDFNNSIINPKDARVGISRFNPKTDSSFVAGVGPSGFNIGFKKPFADGGVAGLLGERTGYFKGALADTKKGKAMSPGTTASGGVRDDNPFTGGGGDNNNPPPVTINNNPPETITFSDVTGKKMTTADRLAKQKFINYLNAKKVYSSGENEEADDLYDAYSTATGLDDFQKNVLIDSTTNQLVNQIDGNTKNFYNRNSTIKDLDTGDFTKQLVVQTPTNFTRRIVRPSGIMENDIAQPFGAPQSLSVDPYADGGLTGLLGERTGFRSAGFISGRTKSSKSKSSTSKGPAGGASAGGNYGGNVNPQQKYAGRTLSQRPSNYGGTGAPTKKTTTVIAPKKTTFKKGITATKATGRTAKEIAYLKSLGKLFAGDFTPALKMIGGQYAWDKVSPKLKGLGSTISNFFFTPAGAADLSEDELNIQRALNQKSYKDTIKEVLPGKTETGGITNVIPDLTDPKLAGSIAEAGGLSTSFKNVGQKKAFGVAIPGTGEQIRVPSNSSQKTLEAIQQDKRVNKLTRDQVIDKALNLDYSSPFSEKENAGAIFDMVQAPGQTPFMAAHGGPARQNFKMGKRAFLKLMAGAGAGIGAAKSGLFSLLKGGGKKQVAKEAIKSAGSGTPPPYFFKLVEKIKMMGDDITEKAATKDREVVKRYKDFELTEDVATGEQTIQRVKIGDDGPQYYDETLAEDVYMNYKPGKGQADETMKGKTPPNEYIEDTGYLRTTGPNKGELYDSMDGLTDDTLKDIMEEVGETIVKKASGGRVPLAGGGIASMLGERTGYQDGLLANIPPEYRLYAGTMLPWNKTGTVDESYFNQDFKDQVKDQVLSKMDRGMEFEGYKHPKAFPSGTVRKGQIFPKDYRTEKNPKGYVASQYGKGRTNPTGYSSVFNTLGTYGYKYNMPTAPVFDNASIDITDKYDWNPNYGTINDFTGYIGQGFGREPDEDYVKGTDVDLKMLKQYVFNQIKNKKLDVNAGLELLGNYLGPKSSKGEGKKIKINIPVDTSITKKEKKKWTPPQQTGGDGGIHGGGGRPRPDKPGGFTDPGKGSYGPHKADGGRVPLSGGGLARMLGE